MRDYSPCSERAGARHSSSKPKQSANTSRRNSKHCRQRQSAKWIVPWSSTRRHIWHGKPLARDSSRFKLSVKQPHGGPWKPGKPKCFGGRNTCIGWNRGMEQQSDTKKQADPAVVTRTPEGDPLVRIGQEAQARIGLEIAPVSPASMQPQVVAYGRLEEDPSRTFVVRSPVAGTLQVSKGASWPSVGEGVAAGQDLGLIEPRIAPAVRISITPQLATPRAEGDSALPAEQSAEPPHERAPLSNSANKTRL